MKTTNKYMAKIGQPVASPNGQDPSPQPETKATFSREIIMMQIRQIFKTARNL